jgi:hypothetical protein
VGDVDSRFMVVDRKGEGRNLEEIDLDDGLFCGSIT